MSDIGIEALRAVVGRADERRLEVSGWSVGNHIEHCCLAMTGIGRGLARSTPPRPRATFNLPRLVIMTLGWIPRGRAQAPEVATPKGIEASALRAMLDESEIAVRDARELSSRAWFEHFALGVLSRDQCLKFLRVHNAHHARIIHEILQSSASSG